MHAWHIPAGKHVIVIIIIIVIVVVVIDTIVIISIIVITVITVTIVVVIVIIIIVVVVVPALGLAASSLRQQLHCKLEQAMCTTQAYEHGMPLRLPCKQMAL